MSTKHTISATRSGTTNGVDWDADYEITFNFTRGAPAQPPSYSHGGLPADPDEIELVSINPGAGDHGAFSDLAQKGLEEWAQEWLMGEGYDKAIELAHAENEPPERERYED